MKLTPKPIAVTDEIDQSRDISGFNKWARSSRTIGFIMLILGWFTIPAEVLLRRDFGQRWFTAVNYFAGFFLLLLFTLLQYVLNPVFEWMSIAIAFVAVYSFHILDGIIKRWQSISRVARWIYIFDLLTPTRAIRLKKQCL